MADDLGDWLYVITVGVLIAITIAGLVVGMLFPDAGMITTAGTASFWAGGIALWVFSTVHGIVFGSTGGNSGAARGMEPRHGMRKSIQDVDDTADIVPPHKVLFGVPVSILKLLPAWLLVVVLSTVFRPSGSIPVPVVGSVFVPWHVLPVSVTVLASLHVLSVARQNNYV